MKKAFGIEKIEKFLLCENPLRNEKRRLNRLFIFHTREPVMLIQLHHMNDLRESLDLTSSDICNVSTMLHYDDGDEEELIARVIFLWDENISKKEIEGVVKRAVDWYIATLSVKPAEAKKLPQAEPSRIVLKALISEWGMENNVDFQTIAEWLWQLAQEARDVNDAVDNQN